MSSYTLYRNLITGLCFTAGMFGLISEQYILSTLLFGMSALASNLQTAKPVRI